MKPRSAKNKGRLLQIWLRDALLRDSNIPKEDIRSTIMGDTGEDIQLSAAARTTYPFQFECKSRSQYSVYKDYEQACSHGEYTPVLIIKQNGDKPLACVDAEWFINYIKENKK